MGNRLIATHENFPKKFRNYTFNEKGYKYNNDERSHEPRININKILLNCSPS